MWVLILTISLKSLYNHALDDKVVSQLHSEESCLNLGKKMTSDLKHYSSDVETTISCIKQ